MRLVVQRTIGSTKPYAAIVQLQHRIQVAFHAGNALGLAIECHHWLAPGHLYLVYTKTCTHPNILLIVGRDVVNKVRTQAIAFVDGDCLMCIHIVADNAIVAAAHPYIPPLQQQAFYSCTVGGRMCKEVREYTA